MVLDNLHGQTTEVFNKECSKGGATQHLLPSGVTDEIQLVDAGIGSALKMEMGNRLDDWLSEDGNLEKWIFEKGIFAMWEKRVLITESAAEAWDHVCCNFNFESAATRICLRMTINDEGDDLIKP